MATPSDITKGAFDGTKLASLRTARNLRQKDLAQRTGRTAAAVSQIETGEFTPSTEWLAAIAEVLDVDVDHLLTDAEMAS